MGGVAPRAGTARGPPPPPPRHHPSEPAHALLPAAAPPHEPPCQPPSPLVPHPLSHSHSHSLLQVKYSQLFPTITPPGSYSVTLNGHSGEDALFCVTIDFMASALEWSAGWDCQYSLSVGMLRAARWSLRSGAPCQAARRQLEALTCASVPPAAHRSTIPQCRPCPAAQVVPPGAAEVAVGWQNELADGGAVLTHRKALM